MVKIGAEVLRGDAGHVGIEGELEEHLFLSRTCGN